MNPIDTIEIQSFDDPQAWRAWRKRLFAPRERPLPCPPMGNDPSSTLLFLIAPGGWPVQAVICGDHRPTLNWRCQLDRQRHSLVMRLFLNGLGQPMAPPMRRLIRRRAYPWASPIALRPDAPLQLFPTHLPPGFKRLLSLLRRDYHRLNDLYAEAAARGMNHEATEPFLQALASAHLLVRAPIALRDRHSPFDFLGLHWSADVPTIRSAYRRLLARRTPKTPRGLLHHAFQLLCHPDYRRRIRRRLMAPPPPRPGEEVSR